MNTLLSTFKRLITIDSPTGREESVANFLVDYLTTRASFVEKDQAGNVFAKIPGTGEPLFLSAHMDTVELGQNIVPVVSNGIIRSKGDTILGADNKSTLAVLLEVIERIRNKKHRPLEILFTTGEEASDPGAEKFDYTKITARKGLVADIALPVGTIILGSPAYQRFDIEFTGKSAHAAFPEKAKNILPVLGSIFSEIKTGNLDDQTILNIGYGKFGSVRNAVPGSATISGELRSYDETLLQQHLKHLLQTVEKTARKSGIKTKIHTAQDNSSYTFDKSDPYIRSIAKIIKEQGLTPVYMYNWSNSDANIFNAKGLQVVNIGDGAKNTHTRDESIATADMEKLATVFQMYCQQ